MSRRVSRSLWRWRDAELCRDTHVGRLAWSAAILAQGRPVAPLHRPVLPSSSLLFLCGGERTQVEDVCEWGVREAVGQ